jgi:hypothetical protein
MAGKYHAAANSPRDSPCSHLNHEYQFNFNLPQAQTAFQRTLAFIATATGS